MDSLHKKVADEMDEALIFALETHEPLLNSMFEDVYAPNLTHPESVGSRIDRALYSDILEGEYR
jgi:TPP-dependent pyruvate/acetoin dehydrogenase alpha subunit